MTGKTSEGGPNLMVPEMDKVRLGGLDIIRTLKTVLKVCRPVLKEEGRTSL